MGVLDVSVFPGLMALGTRGILTHSRSEQIVTPLFQRSRVSPRKMQGVATHTAQFSALMARCLEQSIVFASRNPNLSVGPEIIVQMGTDYLLLQVRRYLTLGLGRLRRSPYNVDVIRYFSTRAKTDTNGRGIWFQICLDTVAGSANLTGQRRRKGLRVDDWIYAGPSNARPTWVAGQFSLKLDMGLAGAVTGFTGNPELRHARLKAIRRNSRVPIRCRMAVDTCMVPPSGLHGVETQGSLQKGRISWNPTFIFPQINEWHHAQGLAITSGKPISLHVMRARRHYHWQCKSLLTGNPNIRMVSGME